MCALSLGVILSNKKDMLIVFSILLMMQKVIVFYQLRNKIMKLQNLALVSSISIGILQNLWATLCPQMLHRLC